MVPVASWVCQKHEQATQETEVPVFNPGKRLKGSPLDVSPEGGPVTPFPSGWPKLPLPSTSFFPS